MQEEEPTPTLLVLAFIEDQAPYLANAELDRRFGDGASDRLASYYTDSHASLGDVQRMAWTETNLLVEIAKGQHTCTALGQHHPHNRICRCGARVE